MSENCSHQCEGCSVQNCSSREGAESLRAPANASSRIKKVVAVMSGKGGVGKSLVCGMLAVLSQRRGLKAGILDADITGPSIPMMFGIKRKASGCEQGILPVETHTGIRMISMNLLLENETDPVVWRGPIIAGTVKQFWTDVCWGDLDVLYVDMPPGTGDVPLTVFQSFPVDGTVLVVSPQELVSMVVEKAVSMTQLMNIPVLGLVENMSYVRCPDCGKDVHLFGESRSRETADKWKIPLIGQIPVDPKLAACCDKGMMELFDGDWLENAVDKVLQIK